MAKRKNVGYWKGVYKEAIEWAGGQISKNISLPKLKQMWKDIRRQHAAEDVELPRVTTVAKEFREHKYEETPRDEEANTLPANEPSDDYSVSPEWQLAFDYVEDYIKGIRDVYNDTISYIASAPLNSKGNVKDTEFYFLSMALPEFESEFNEIMRLLKEYIVEYGYIALARALANAPQIDYARGLIFVPPSDMEDRFDELFKTLAGLTISAVL